MIKLTNFRCKHGMLGGNVEKTIAKRVKTLIEKEFSKTQTTCDVEVCLSIIKIDDSQPKIDGGNKK